MNRKNETVRSVVLGTVRRQPLLCTALVLAVAGAVAASCCAAGTGPRGGPPDGPAGGALCAGVGVLWAAGTFRRVGFPAGKSADRVWPENDPRPAQRHVRQAGQAPGGSFVNQESGAAVSRFVGDVDTVEELFTSGIISMFADACRLCGILAVIFAENRGLALILLVVAAAVSLYPRGAKADAESAAAKPCRCGAGFRPCAGNAALHPHHPHPSAGKLHGKSL